MSLGFTSVMAAQLQDNKHGNEMHNSSDNAAGLSLLNQQRKEGNGTEFEQRVNNDRGGGVDP